MRKTRRPSWRNEEGAPGRSGLSKVSSPVRARNGPPITSPRPIELALAVVQALDEWEARGRPGARKTFASPADYFEGKNPRGQFQILDFRTTLLGREKQIRALDDFAKDHRSASAS